MDGFYDVTTNQFITFQGDTSASFYLQVSGGDGTTEAPQLTSLQVQLEGTELVTTGPVSRVHNVSESFNPVAGLRGLSRRIITLVYGHRDVRASCSFNRAPRLLEV